MKQQGLRHANPPARRVLEKLVEGLDEFGAHKRIDNAKGAYMAVSVERVEETPYGPIFSVAHYFEQNSDLVPDPDVTFLRAADGDFYPLSYQDARTYRLAVELGSDGTVRVDRAQQADLAGFVTNWMRNVRQQQGL
jgi:hypothetical protein